MLTQTTQSVGPELVVEGKPVVNGSEFDGMSLTKAFPALGLHGNQAGGLQGFDMLGHPLPAHIELLSYLGNGKGCAGQNQGVEDLTPGRIGDGLEQSINGPVGFFHL